MNDTAFKLQMALLEFNKDKPNWWNWKRVDDSEHKLPNDQRMTYANVIVHDDSITKPSESDINTKIQELKDVETASANKKASGKSKLKELGLDDAEIKALIGA